MAKLKAAPKRETIMRTAVCANCGEVLYQRPHERWVHDDGNAIECAMPEVS